MDLDFLTEEVKKLARQTGEFLKKERLSFDRSRVEQRMTMCRTWTKHLKNVSWRDCMNCSPKPVLLPKKGPVRWKNRNTVGWWTPWTERAIIFTTARRIA